MTVAVDKFNVPGGTQDALIQPKLSYRFRVVLNGFGGNSGDEVLELTSQVVSVTRPSLTHDDIVVDVYNSRIFLAGKHTWDAVTLTVRDDVTGNVARSIARQLQNQIDHASQSGAKAGQNYKFAMAIENLDGASDSPEVLDKWELAGCYIQNVNYGENNYSTSDPLQITIAIKFDNANHYVMDSPYLESDSRPNTGDLSTEQGNVN
jgi:hypothetical protein